VWVYRHCHQLTYAATVAPDREHWVGVGLLTRILRKLGSDSADPFSPLPPRPKGMWRRKYEQLAAEFREAQNRLLQSLCSAARWSIRQQGHQIAYGRLAKQRKALRERTLELAAKEKEAMSRKYWPSAALMSGQIPQFPTEEESRELDELRQCNGRMDDLERFAAANPDRFRTERVRRR
jgi:hypothetical protein